MKKNKLSISLTALILMGGLFSHDLLAANDNQAATNQSNSATVTITNPDGSSVKKLQDGTKIITNANGSSVKTSPDGTELHYRYGWFFSENQSGRNKNYNKRQ